MRAFVASPAPETLACLAEVPEPEPTSDQALVSVEAFSLNRPDYLYLAIPGSTFRPGIDAVGRILHPAADGSGPAAGSRVLLHSPEGGAAAERIAVSTGQIASVPDSLDSATAAALPLGGLVARRLLDRLGDLAGRRLVATGVGGGVGQFLVQSAGGAEITAVAAQDEPWEHLPQLGAKVAHRASDLTDASFDAALESVGGELGSAIASKLRTGGTFLWFGQAGGEPITLDFFGLFSGGQSLTLHHFVYSQGMTGGDREDLEALVVLAASGHLRAEIGHRGSWEETPSVLQRLGAGRMAGKAVLSVTG
ncbi:zinc-binding dehydrogenase [Streptomyces sp. GMY02]|uniref:zinc-binding dehydrogenase n=1 Tax=Streptomyces sp. GMY02 TaxID=1333528 RepID=UPI001C2BE772|nr:zinc-binding dehydrogenase [Streptomyces sp. GMY02]QXE38414.1 zinc-binding dehydrogenase [Streptomyces sp. GMY02]